MPPDYGVDFDMQLERTLHSLDSLRSEMTYDVFMMYCSSNVPQIFQKDKKVSPLRIYDDLKKSGFKVFEFVLYSEHAHTHARTHTHTHTHTHLTALYSGLSR